MNSPLLSGYGPIVTSLLQDVSPAPLDAGEPNEKFRPILAALTAENLFSTAGPLVRDPRMAQSCLAGLWLRHNFLKESHALSQEIETPTGSYWHAILHRREGDFGNARYWFRRIGPHPIFPALNEAAAAIGWVASPLWQPMALVDHIEQSLRRKTPDDLTEICLTVQQIEWELLFDFSWKQAMGGK